MKLRSDIEKNENKSTDIREDFFCSNDDNFAFVPVENIRMIERVINNLEEVKQRLNKIVS